MKPLPNPELPHRCPRCSQLTGKRRIAWISAGVRFWQAMHNMCEAVVGVCCEVETPQPLNGSSQNATDYRPLGLSHRMRIKAAELWLRLGQVEEAGRELDQISFFLQRHPDVAQARDEVDALKSCFVANELILEPGWDADWHCGTALL